VSCKLAKHAIGVSADRPDGLGASRGGVPRRARRVGVVDRSALGSVTRGLWHGGPNLVDLQEGVALPDVGAGLRVAPAPDEERLRRCLSLFPIFHRQSVRRPFPHFDANAGVLAVVFVTTAIALRIPKRRRITTWLDAQHQYRAIALRAAQRPAPYVVAAMVGIAPMAVAIRLTRPGPTLPRRAAGAARAALEGPPAV